MIEIYDATKGHVTAYIEETEPMNIKPSKPFRLTSAVNIDNLGVYQGTKREQIKQRICEILFGGAQPYCGKCGVFLGERMTVTANQFATAFTLAISCHGSRREYAVPYATYADPCTSDLRDCEVFSGKSETLDNGLQSAAQMMAQNGMPPIRNGARRAIAGTIQPPKLETGRAIDLGGADL